MSPHREPLHERLAQRLSAHGQGRATAWDVLVAAGRVWRVEPEAPVLLRVPRLRGSELRQRASDALEAALDVDEDSPLEQSARALAALEEVALVAALLDRPRAVSGSIERAIGGIRAFPEPWAAHADAASARLEVLSADDPAWSLWAAVEASVEGVPDEPGDAPPRVLEALGLPVAVSLGELCGELRLAAASGLPAESPWLSLAVGPGWEVALTTDVDDAPIVLLAGSSGRFRRDEVEVGARRTAEGWVCAAEPGRWQVSVDGHRVRFEVRP